MTVEGMLYRMRTGSSRRDLPEAFGSWRKGAALGTVLAFVMSVIALSLPEMVILRKVLKVRLIATLIGVVAVGILIVGYVFNFAL